MLLDLLNARGRATARLHVLDELMMLMSRSSWLRPALEEVRVITLLRDFQSKKYLLKFTRKFPRKIP